ncbi:MAG: hypothetical protein A6F72_01905 [Cycloclasticus sp. symbiont of Poecilosclerida sp. N]|nr:MAG: hypothetical protein A6F72_01905 [Cycloclasticus sp. symbiont of Poecilosclerida sp. N]
MCQELILSWQATKNEQWFPVGRFAKQSNVYSFVYTKGAKKAKENGFIGLASMQNFDTKYYYEDVFPLLKNRILNKSRPDRDEFLKWLEIESEDSDFEELAKTGGIKATDNLQLFPVPIKENNRYTVSFFAQGISHLTRKTQLRIEQLKKGEKLYFCADLENPQDKNAHLLRTDDPVEMVGYCPKHFAKDFKRLFDLSKESFNIEVQRVNKDAPEQLRLLCKINCDWHSDFSPFSEPEFE